MGNSTPASCPIVNYLVCGPTVATVCGSYSRVLAGRAGTRLRSIFDSCEV